MTRVIRPKPKRKRRRKGGKRYSLRHAVAAAVSPSSSVSRPGHAVAEPLSERARVAATISRPDFDRDSLDYALPQESWRLPEEDDPNCRHAWGWSSAWDAANSRLFVSQTRAEDFDETIIHVWQIQ